MDLGKSQRETTERRKPTHYNTYEKAFAHRVDEPVPRSHRVAVELDLPSEAAQEPDHWPDAEQPRRAQSEDLSDQETQKFKTHRKIHKTVPLKSERTHAKIHS